MTPLKKRLLSLLWRVGGMTLVFLLEAIVSNLGVLELSTEMTIFIGLVLGEITKEINNRRIFSQEIDELTI